MIDLSPTVDQVSLISYWRQELGRGLGFAMVDHELSAEQASAAIGLAKDKFVDESWTHRR